MTFIKRWLIRRCLLEKFVLNTKLHGYEGFTDNDEEIFISADGFGAEAINFSFQWSVTKEGWRFWNDVHNKFKESYEKKCLT